MKPAKPGELPKTPPTNYLSPGAKTAYNANVRRAAAEADLKNSKALLAAKTSYRTNLIAAQKTALASGKPSRITQQELVALNKEISTISSRISKLETSIIPNLKLEVKASLSAIKNPITRTRASIAISNAQKAAIEAKYMASWQWWFKKLLSVLGVITPLYQLYAEYDRIDKLNNTTQEKTSAKAQAWGVFEAQLGALIVARLAEARIVAGVVKAFQIGAGLAGGVFTGGASIAASLLGAAATDALITWMGTDAGRKYLVTHIGWAIQHGGEFAEGFWSGLVNFAKGVSGQPA